MTLGEKLRQARLEAGLSQRALCGDVITRNMLSQIENGSAKPSMDTLRHLAAQLQKPVSYFLEEAPPAAQTPPLWEGILSLEQARLLLDAGRASDAVQALHRAEAQLQDAPHWVQRQFLLLKARFCPEQAQALTVGLPSLDAELLLRAQAALDGREAQRCTHLLACCEDRSAHWQLLMGEALLLQERFTEAAAHFRTAEQQYPHRCCEALEVCYRELEDYQKAYHYACRMRSLSK